MPLHRNRKRLNTEKIKKIEGRGNGRNQRGVNKRERKKGGNRDKLKEDHKEIRARMV